MGPRSQFDTAYQAEILSASRPSWLHSPDNALEVQILQSRNTSPQTPFAGGNGHAQAEKGMGARSRTRQTTSHERHRHVHDWQQPANLFYHDGLHVVQGARPGHLQYSGNISEARERWKQAADAPGESDVRGVQYTGTSVGDLEGERDGIVAVSTYMDTGEGYTDTSNRTTSSDWLAWESAREPMERAFYVP